ncbi:MAG: SBBP repeat-containing protein [Candidatus Staskawiczbacteria bacterium]|nr:SBBP repeat-containing protein [Candidatus Staskawiczbacteria bacterium]
MIKRLKIKISVALCFTGFLLLGFANHASATTYTWNPFLGGSGGDVSYGVTVDTSGNVYAVGYSDTTWGSPIRGYSAQEDAFVAKLSSTGSIVWNTFLGGSGYDDGYGIAVDSSGNVYVTGKSDGTWGSPIVEPTGGNNYFIAKLNVTGSLVWNTFLSNTNVPQTTAISLDTSGNIYVVGSASSTWGSPILPWISAQYSYAFAAKLSNNGNLIWNTFFGGGTRKYNYGKGVVVDSSGNIYIIGYGNATWGTPVRIYAANQDAWVVKLTNTGTLAWSTFLGGSGNDYGAGVAVDGTGNVYVAGYSDATWGSPLQLYNSSNDIFVAKLDSAGTMTWNTFLGGIQGDIGTGIILDNSNSVYITGYSNATWGSPLRAYYGQAATTDVCVAKLNNSGSLLWNTFLGDSGSDKGQAIVSDTTGNIYVGGVSSATWESPPIAHTVGASNDAYVAKLTSAGALVTITTSHTITASTVNSNGSITPTGATTVDDGANQTFTISANDPYTTNVIVDGASQGPLTTYTFTNVTTNHTILADFSLVLGAGGGASASASSGTSVSSGTSTSATSSTSDSSSQPPAPSADVPTPTVTPPPTPTPDLTSLPPATPDVTAISTPGNNTTFTAAVIVQIKQQLIALITQLIGILQQQFIQMGK